MNFGIWKRQEVDDRKFFIKCIEQVVTMTNVSKMVNKSEEIVTDTVVGSKPKAKEKRRWVDCDLFLRSTSYAI